MQQRETHLDVVKSLLESESHTTADDQGVDLVKHVLDKLDLVGNLGTTEDGKERTLGLLEDLGEVLELLLHEEARGALRELDADHGRVGTVGSSEAAMSVIRMSLVGVRPTHR